MPILAKPRPTRILSIDFGLARLGLAISDEMKMIATPLPTFQAKKKQEDTVQQLLQFLEKHAAENRYDLEKIIIGMPFNMNGTVGHFADEVKHFISLLQQKLSIPIIPWDERLTSVMADRSLRESSLSRKKRAQKVDSISALIILQNYLESIKI